MSLEQNNAWHDRFTLLANRFEQTVSAEDAEKNRKDEEYARIQAESRQVALAFLDLRDQAQATLDHMILDKPELEQMLMNMTQRSPLRIRTSAITINKFQFRLPEKHRGDGLRIYSDKETGSRISLLRLPWLFHPAPPKNNVLSRLNWWARLHYRLRARFIVTPGRKEDDYLDKRNEPLNEETALFRSMSPILEKLADPDYFIRILDEAHQASQAPADPTPRLENGWILGPVDL